MEAYDKLLQCFTPKALYNSSDDESKKKKVQESQIKGLNFDERKFREIRYGFVASKINASLN